MTCEEYYKHHPDPGTPSRCKITDIESSTARAVALLGAGTTIFGVVNLFWTGWCIKRFGIKSALLTACLWPAVRLVVQNIGVQTGANLGIIIIQCSQIITIIGGPAGYFLALNSYATEMSTPAERTGTLGRLQGLAFFGTSLGYLAGGLLSDVISTIAPFRVTLALFCISTAYVFFALPEQPHSMTPEQLQNSASISAFLEPLRMFVPRKWELRSGHVKIEYGVLLLGAGTFCAVLATGYIPVLLQMFATDVLDFNATENGYLISANSLVRGIFLTFMFPPIIDWGRNWLGKRRTTRREALDRISSETTMVPSAEEELQPGLVEDDPTDDIIKTAKTNSAEEESFQFDLIYTRWSILVDAILTGLATFAAQRWQLYLVAIILPFAAGTGSAAKGTILQMCSPEERIDALNAISLIEMAARLSTVALFGYVFAAFADIGRSNLTFLANGAVAFLAFLILIFARFPPHGSTRFVKQDAEEED